MMIAQRAALAAVPIGAIAASAAPTPTPTPSVPFIIGTGAEAAGQGAISVPYPATVPADAFAMLCVASANEPLSAAPSGWSPFSQTPKGIGPAAGYPNSVALNAYYRWCAGSEGGSGVAVPDTGFATTGLVTLVGGVNRSNPIDAHDCTSESFNTTRTFPALTTTVPKALIVHWIAAFYTAAVNVTAFDNPNLSGKAIVGNFVSAGLNLMTGVMDAPGAIGNSTATISQNTRAVELAIALAPA